MHQIKSSLLGNGFMDECRTIRNFILKYALRARFKITFRPRRSTLTEAAESSGTTRKWTCPLGCGGEGPSPLSLALRDTPLRIASGSLRGAGTGPPSGSLCCRKGPPLGARNAARNFILQHALRLESSHFLARFVSSSAESL